MTTLHTQIMLALSRLGKNGTAIPDDTSKGRALGELFLWQTVSKYADAKLNTAKQAVEDTGLILNDTSPGQHLIGKSQHYAYAASVTNPVKRFDEDTLVELATKSKYKIPPVVIREWVNEAKIPGKPKVTKVVTEL